MWGVQGWWGRRVGEVCGERYGAFLSFIYIPLDFFDVHTGRKASDKRTNAPIAQLGERKTEES